MERQSIGHSDLHDKNIQLLPESKREKDSVYTLFDYIEQYPIIDIGKTAERLNLSYNAVSNAVKKLVALGILKKQQMHPETGCLHTKSTLQF